MVLPLPFYFIYSINRGTALLRDLSTNMDWQAFKMRSINKVFEIDRCLLNEKAQFVVRLRFLEVRGLITKIWEDDSIATY